MENRRTHQQAPHGRDWSKWMMLVQLVAVWVSTVGLFLVWGQLRLSTQATQALVVQSLTAQSQESIVNAMAHPNATRLAFPMYGPGNGKPGPDDYLQAQLLASDLLCHFEAIIGQEKLLAEDQREGFRQLMTFMFSASPMLHATVEQSPKGFYSPQLRQIARENPYREAPVSK
jgi:hypothetical protein